MRLALRAPQAAFANTHAVLDELAAQVAALHAGDLVRGSSVSGIFVPRGTGAPDQLVFSMTPPEEATARARLCDGPLSVVTRGAATWTMITARLERVTCAAALFKDAIGHSKQLDGLFKRLIRTKSGDAVLLNKYERVLNGSVRAEQWFYLGVRGVERPPDVTVKEGGHGRLCHRGRRRPS